MGRETFHSTHSTFFCTIKIFHTSHCEVTVAVQCYREALNETSGSYFDLKGAEGYRYINRYIDNPHPCGYSPPCPHSLYISKFS